MILRKEHEQDYNWVYPENVRDNIKPILYDKEKRVVAVGDWIVEKHFYYEYNHHVMGYFSDAPLRNHPKERNKDWSEFLGIPPTVYRKLLNGIMYDVFIKDDEKFINTYCREFKGRVDNNRLSSFIKDRVWFYNLHETKPNIVPIALRLGKDNYQKHESTLLRELSENSKHRNSVISRVRFDLLDEEEFQMIKSLPTSLIAHSAGLWFNRGLMSDRVKEVSHFLKKNKLLTKLSGSNVISNTMSIFELGFDVEALEIDRQRFIMKRLPYCGKNNSDHFMDINKPTLDELTMMELEEGGHVAKSFEKMFSFLNIEVAE